MIKKLLVGVLIWFCGFGNSVFAQKENYVWYFGEGVGIDFNSGIPVPLIDSMIYTFEGCATICDTTGNLLFCTEGVNVYGKNHLQMPNGDSLDGNHNSTQSALIVPFPGNNLLYYIFTVEESATGANNYFSYAVVDMSLNNGNGDVTLKNVLIDSSSTEKLTAVKHSNNFDTWVMIHGTDNNKFSAYLVTSSGISSTPVISNVGITFTYDSKGYMKFSPDGSKIAFAAFNTGCVELFDFNASTGTVSNEKYLTLPPSVYDVYGIEFSRSGNYLYWTAWQLLDIFQWDISSNSAPIINSTLQSIGTISAGVWLGALQLGPDGKIYVSSDWSPYLGVINNPELSGVQCNYNELGIYFGLTGPSCELGLPNFITSYFLPTGINTNNPQQNRLTISPNPATDKITISFAATTSENITIKIYSITGEVVFEKLFQSSETLEKLNATKTIDVKDFSNGIYFLSVQTGREVVTKKIVVNH